MYDISKCDQYIKSFNEAKTYRTNKNIANMSELTALVSFSINFNFDL